MQSYFSRTFQDSSVYSSTFQACANPALFENVTLVIQDTSTSCHIIQTIIFHFTDWEGLSGDFRSFLPYHWDLSCEPCVLIHIRIKAEVGAVKHV